jgi:plastocyanin
MTSRRSALPIWSLATILALLALGLAGCGGGDDTNTTGGGGGGTSAGGNAAPSGGGPAPRAETVEMVDFDFDAATVTIQAGGKVIWKNQGQAPHTATADDGGFDTGTVPPGKLKSETFKEPGTFDYHCEIHPQMHGTIEVVSG